MDERIAVQSQNTENTMTVTKSEAIDILNEIRAKALDLYGFNRSVRFIVRNMGTSGGWARYDNFQIELNVQYLQTSRQAVYEVLAHEVAHLVCFDKKLGKGHDKGWKRVCLALGGNGNRCHSFNFKPKRKTRQAVYEVNGQTVKVGLIQHRRLQSNPNYRLRMNPCGTEIKTSMFTGRLVAKGA